MNVAQDAELEPIPWDEWSRLTRFLESARLAFGREHTLWNSLELAEPDTVNIAASAGLGAYTVRLDTHLAAVADVETLYGAVLIQSYAFAEATAASRLRMSATDFGGIEDWGQRLLDDASGTWDRVKDERAGAVQVAVIRNAFAHGTRRLRQSDVNRLDQVGITGHVAGDVVTLEYQKLRDLRARLKSLLRAHEGAGA